MPSYSSERREAVVAKLLPPRNLSVREVAQQGGISEPAAHKRRKEAREQGRCLPNAGDGGTAAWSSKDKFGAVLETTAMNGAELAEYGRRRSVYPDQIATWRQDCEQAASLSQQERRQEALDTKAQRETIRERERDLKRKKAALAETLCSVIIVSFNSGTILVECVRQVLGSTSPVEILVSDNGSVDASVDLLRKAFGKDKRLRIAENGENIGFSAAANRVLPMAAGNWLLFLNPDCIVEPDTLERMLTVIAARPEAGMGGCVLRNPDGTEQAGCRRREPTPVRSLARVLSVGRFRRRHGSLGDFNLDSDPLPTEPVAVDAISGAFMLVRRSALDRVGPLDEEYFLHCEDLDWCRRFRDAGYTVLFVPFVEVLHVKGVSSRSRPVRVEWHKHRGMLRYYRKFFENTHPRVLGWAIRVAVWGHFLAVTIGIVFRRGRRGG